MEYVMQLSIDNESNESAGTLLLVGRVPVGLQIDGVIVYGTGSSVIFYFFGEVEEGLLHVASAFCTYLQKQHIMLLRHLLGLILVNLSIVLQVTLGANQDLADSLAGVAFDLFDPAPNVLEALLIIDGVGQDYPGSSLVVCLRDIPEALLPSSIPDLKFDLRVLHMDRLEFEIHPDGGHIAILEHTVAELSEEVRLTHPAVSDDDHLGQKVMLVLLIRHLFDIIIFFHLYTTACSP
jgi:hypothetical protein